MRIEKVKRTCFIPSYESESGLERAILSYFEEIHPTRPPADPIKNVKAGDMITIKNAKTNKSIGFLKVGDNSFKPLWAREETTSQGTRLMWPNRSLIHNPKVSVNISLQTDKTYGANTVSIRNEEDPSDLLSLPYDKISHFKPKTVEFPGFFIQRNRYEKARNVHTATFMLLTVTSSLNTGVVAFDMGANISKEGVLFL